MNVKIKKEDCRVFVEIATDEGILISKKDVTDEFMMVAEDCRLHAKPRRWGKTTRLLKRASVLAGEGHRVLFVSYNIDSAKRCKKMFESENHISLWDKVLFLSKNSKNSFRGLSPCHVIMDEVYPTETEELREVLPVEFFPVDLGYYTPPEMEQSIFFSSESLGKCELCSKEKSEEQSEPKQ